MPPRPPATTMPAEWAPHERTWMAWPRPNATFGAAGGPDLARARRAWAGVARAVARHEPVTVLADPDDASGARTALGPDVVVLPVPLDDAWLRDSGPTFVHAADGSVAAVDWVFNGWGAQAWAAWERDAQVAGSVASHAGVSVRRSRLVNEGGGLHVDGEGTVLLTETVQLDPARNPGLSRHQVEQEVHAQLGTTTAVWLPRGLTRDYGTFGTRGHVDIVAAFAGPGTVLLHAQRDDRHPDAEVTRRLRAVLEAAVDARGRRLRVVDLPAPTVLEDDEGPVDWSYVNHYVCNGAVVLPAFDDPHDAVAEQVLREAYPGRAVEPVDARDVFAFGGGVHCTTQQQPARRPA